MIRPRWPELFRLAKANPFACFALGFMAYDAAFHIVRIYQHPSDIDLLVASMGVVLAALAASLGFQVAQSPRSIGLEHVVRISQQGPSLLLLRIGFRSLAVLVLGPVVLYLLYLTATGTIFRSLQWLLYIMYVPAQTLLGFAFGVVAGRLMACAWSPRSTGVTSVLASIFGVGVFFTIISVPPTKDPTSPLNAALVSVALPPVVRLNSVVILRQELVTIGVAVLLLGALIACSAHFPRGVLSGLTASVLGAGITAVTFAIVPSTLVDRVPPTYCVGTVPVVCSVPLEARGARFLSADLNAIGSQLPELVPRKVVQETGFRPAKDRVDLLRLPGSRERAPAYSIEIVLDHAGCTLDDIDASQELREGLSEFQGWLAQGGRDMPPQLRSRLKAIPSLCPA